MRNTSIRVVSMHSCNDFTPKNAEINTADHNKVYLKIRQYLQALHIYIFWAITPSMLDCLFWHQCVYFANSFIRKKRATSQNISILFFYLNVPKIGCSFMGKKGTSEFARQHHEMAAVTIRTSHRWRNNWQKKGCLFVCYWLWQGTLQV